MLVWMRAVVNDTVHVQVEIVCVVCVCVCVCCVCEGLEYALYECEECKEGH